MTVELHPIVRAKLIAARQTVRSRHVDEDGKPLPFLNTDHAGASCDYLALLAAAAGTFARYDLPTTLPLSSASTFDFSDGGRLSVELPSLYARSGAIRGTLREKPNGGGAVRALEVTLAHVEWDPGTGRLVPRGGEGSETALEVVISALLRTLQLDGKR